MLGVLNMFGVAQSRETLRSEALRDILSLREVSDLAPTSIVKELTSVLKSPDFKR